MNYYEHHIGDHLREAAHLNFMEEGALRRLRDSYFAREAPLPADVKECCKLARATSRPEREVVRSMLAQFFELHNDGYHFVRGDTQISKFRARSESAKRSAEARWHSEENSMRTHSVRNADAAQTALRTHSVRNAEAMQRAPVPISQEALSNSHASAKISNGETLEARACRLMREAGCVRVNPLHPDLIAAIAEWITPETLAATAKEAVEKGKGNPFEWAIATARGRAADGGRNGTHGSGGSESLCERAERLAREGDEHERLAAVG